MPYPQNPTSVPTIKALRRRLDYNDSRLPRCQAFYDSVHVFRKWFITSERIKGSALLDWKSEEHQTGLAEMARAYLELHGETFWPDDKSHNRANKLKCSTHGACLNTTLRQLFWRSNLYQHRNAKYKKRMLETGTDSEPALLQPRESDMGSKAVESCVSNEPTDNEAPRVPPVGQIRVDFIYRVVLAHPERRSFTWQPEGSFQRKTLSELGKELQSYLDWSQYKYLHFQLVAPNTHARQLVCRGREDHFNALKRHFTELICECIIDTPRGKTLLVEILIEPRSDPDLGRKWMDKGIIEFDW